MQKTHTIDDKDEQRKYGRKFIETLLTTFKADVNTQVQKKKFEANDLLPASEKYHYQDPDEGSNFLFTGQAVVLTCIMETFQSLKSQAILNRLEK